MTNDGNPQPLAVIVGERLKLFRAQRDLRQADIAAAATSCGLAWSRSSVAALESGSRNLSVEEFILLPFVISNAGGWDEPLIPPATDIRVAKRTHLRADGVTTMIDHLFHPVGSLEQSRTVPPEEEESVRWAVPPVDGYATELERQRAHSQVGSWRLFFSKLYPHVEFDQVISTSRAEYELLTKITDRLEAGWEDLPVPWYVAAVYGQAMWGKTPGQERDRRAGDISTHASKRSLQSTRGHITRELIREIQERIDRDKTILDHEFSRLRKAWEDPEKLRQYGVDTYAEADAHRRRVGIEQDIAMSKTPDLEGHTIGYALQKARLEMGITLEEVSALADIPLPAIKAIEQDDYSLCGDDAKFACVYIRAFARAVALSPHELVQQYIEKHGYPPLPHDLASTKSDSGSSHPRKWRRRNPKTD